MRKKKADRALVCATVDVAIVVPGTVFDRRCSLCGCCVAMSPAGQQELARRPETVIWCSDCCDVHKDEVTQYRLVPGILSDLTALGRQARKARYN